MFLKSTAQTFLISSSFQFLLKAEELCTVENKQMMEILTKAITANYQPVDQDSEEMIARLPTMAEFTLDKIQQTGKVPCQLYAKAEDWFSNYNFKSVNDDKGFNCYDDECDVAIDLRGIWGYGCWCNFGEKLLNGRGTPVTPHDAACKKMQLCLRCAEMDGVDGGYDCSPRTVSYNSTLNQAVPDQNDNINSINSGCQVLNPNDKCGAHVCTCEIQLINDILELVWTGIHYETFPRHPENPFGGTFEHQEHCQSNNGISDIQCCGKYPFRYTFNALDKSCCDSVEKLYNPFDTMCCDEGLQKISDGTCN